MALAAELEQVDDGSFHEVRYHKNERYIKAVAPLIFAGRHAISDQKEASLLDYRRRWGAGHDLCLLFGRAIPATLILTGRAASNDAIAAKLATLRQLGATQAVYYQGDVADQQQMQAILTNIKTAYGGLTGLIHAAGAQNPRLIHQRKKVG